MTWQDCGMYWAWRGPREPTCPAPTRKRLEYAQLHGIAPMQICCGVWDDDKYTPLHRDEIKARGGILPAH